MCVCVCVNERDARMYGPEKLPNFKCSVGFEFAIALKLTRGFSRDEALSN